MIAAWVFTAVEVVILILNVLLSFALSGGHVDGYLGVWYSLTPSSPLFALVGWILIIHLDRSQQERHHDLEMEAEMQQAEREHKIATHEAKMQLRKSFLESHTTYLEQEVNSPEIQRQLAIGASVLAARELSALTGMHIAPRLNSPTAQTHVSEETDVSPQAALPAPTAQAEEKQVERLTLLAEAAQAQGYSLDDLERLLGVPSSNGNGAAKKN